MLTVCVSLFVTWKTPVLSWNKDPLDQQIVTKALWNGGCNIGTLLDLQLDNLDLVKFNNLDLVKLQDHPWKYTTKKKSLKENQHTPTPTIQSTKQPRRIITKYFMRQEMQLLTEFKKI